MENKFLTKALEVVDYFKSSGQSLLNTEGDLITGNKINIENKGEFLNFSFCDYVGITSDPRVLEGAIDAIKKNGVYTAISRSFLKLNLYKEAEDIVSQIFGKPVLILSKTTLSHLTVLPLLINQNDAVILDHQVHTTVRIATDMLKGYGIHIDIIRHSDLTALEEKIKDLSSKYERIWYLVDGVYSMFGDGLPAQGLETLLDKYEKFHLYVDDAHGMSWTGKNGSGFALSKMAYHPKMFLVTTAGKGFGAGGSIVVCPNEEIYKKILYVGVTLMFTSPVEPPTLGAIIASAKIHLSDEINQRQRELESLMKYFYQSASQLDIPLIDSTPTPIAMVGTGKPEFAEEIARSLFEEKIHVTGAIYPAVPYNNSGIRIMINLHQTKSDIDKILGTLDNAFKKAYKEKGISKEQIIKHYKLPK